MASRLKLDQRKGSLWAQYIDIGTVGSVGDSIYISVDLLGYCEVLPVAFGSEKLQWQMDL